MQILSNKRLTSQLLFTKRQSHYQAVSQQGFSLLELLVVLTILVAISGIGLQVYQGTEQDAKSALTEVELSELAGAVRRFHDDTGFWPRVGGVATTNSDGNCNDSENGSLIAAVWDDSIPPFDWRVLMTGEDDDGNLLCAWNEISQRGWRGPRYIEQKLLNCKPTAAVMHIDAAGLENSNDAETYNADSRYRLDDLYATQYALDDDDKVCPLAVDADQSAYALLVLNERNVIVAAGENGEHELLPFECDDDCQDEDDAERVLREADYYQQLCQGATAQDDYPTLTILEDDKVICP